MEQVFAVFGVEWKLLVVQILNFGVLLAALSYFLYRPLMKLIEERRTQIIEGVAQAERAQAALRDADAKKAEIITRASLDAEAALTAARAAAKEREARLIDEARTKSDRIIAEAALAGDELRRAALTEGKEELARLVVLGVEQTLRATRSPAQP